MQNLKTLLQNELLTALGCTEPIAIALCCAKARSLLDNKDFEKIDLYLSACVIKNANSVCVPNAGGKKGIHIAAAMGASTMQAQKMLNVLEGADMRNIEEAQGFIDQGKIILHHEENAESIYIKCHITGKGEYAVCLIEGGHSHICYLEKNGEVLLDSRHQIDPVSDEKNFQLTIDDIFRFAREVDFTKEKDLKALLLSQERTNNLIAAEGLSGAWGEQVGRTILDAAFSDIEQEAIANAAAGSDARMAGCSKPVIINAGSGNQGIVCSVPVSYMAKKLGKDEDSLLRALVISNLVALYQKHFIGKLSAFCGAISASAGAACAVGFLKGLSDEQLKMTIINTLACSGGIICDGAKASCAIKIASGLQSSFLGLRMAEKGLCFKTKDGIVGQDVDETIQNIGRIASDGMSYTNDVILDIMVNQGSKS